MNRTLTLAGAALVALAASTAAQAQNRPVLKAEAVVTGDIVRIGDLIENAGIVANVAIFRAPDLGMTGTVRADTVVEAVRAHALIGFDTAGLSEVAVTRASRSIPAEEIEHRIAEALSRQYALGQPKDIGVSFERELRAIQVEPRAKGEPRVAHITYDARTGRFDATLEIPTGAGHRGNLRLAGRAMATAEVVTLLRPLERGALVKSADLVIERRPRAEIGHDAVTGSDQAIGLAARNSLQAGRPLRGADLMKPELVQRNETVTLVYEVPGIVLTMRGKAIDGGAEGDVIGVLNEQSKRMVQGVVIGAGRVAIGGGAPRLAANIAPTQSVASVNPR